MMHDDEERMHETPTVDSLVAAGESSSEMLAATNDSLATGSSISRPGNLPVEIIEMVAGYLPIPAYMQFAESSPALFKLLALPKAFTRYLQNSIDSWPHNKAFFNFSNFLAPLQKLSQEDYVRTQFQRMILNAKNKKDAVKVINALSDVNLLWTTTYMKNAPDLRFHALENLPQANIPEAYKRLLRERNQMTEEERNKVEADVHLTHAMANMLPNDLLKAYQERQNARDLMPPGLQLANVDVQLTRAMANIPPHAMAKISPATLQGHYQQRLEARLMPNALLDDLDAHLTAAMANMPPDGIERNYAERLDLRNKMLPGPVRDLVDVHLTRAMAHMSPDGIAGNYKERLDLRNQMLEGPVRDSVDVHLTAAMANMSPDGIERNYAERLDVRNQMLEGPVRDSVDVHLTRAMANMPPDRIAENYQECLGVRAQMPQGPLREEVDVHLTAAMADMLPAGIAENYQERLNARNHFRSVGLQQKADFHLTHALANMDKVTNEQLLERMNVYRHQWPPPEQYEHTQVHLDAAASKISPKDIAINYDLYGFLVPFSMQALPNLSAALSMKKQPFKTYKRYSELLERRNIMAAGDKRDEVDVNLTSVLARMKVTVPPEIYDERKAVCDQMRGGDTRNKMAKELETIVVKNPSLQSSQGMWDNVYEVAGYPQAGSPQAQSFLR